MERTTMINITMIAKTKIAKIDNIMIARMTNAITRITMIITATLATKTIMM
jgi:hypothetical protein